MAIKGEREESIVKKEHYKKEPTTLGLGLWARLPAPHTADNSREEESKGKDSKRQKGATGTVWARLPAPHTATTAGKKRARGKRAPLGLYGLDYQRHTQPSIAREKIARDKSVPLRLHGLD